MEARESSPVTESLIIPKGEGVVTVIRAIAHPQEDGSVVHKLFVRDPDIAARALQEAVIMQSAPRRTPLLRRAAVFFGEILPRPSRSSAQ